VELVYFESVEKSGWEEAVKGLLVLGDKEFVPPLSSRGSSTQAELSGGVTVSGGILDYYNSMAQQPVILGLEDGRCLGFMAFKIDYTCEQIAECELPNLYASTCVVHPDARGKGMMSGFYRKMIDLFPERRIFTRTWHTNLSHLHVLDKLGFSLIARLPDHRGKGMDTVYFRRPAEK